MSQVAHIAKSNTVLPFGTKTKHDLSPPGALSLIRAVEHHQPSGGCTAMRNDRRTAGPRWNSLVRWATAQTDVCISGIARGKEV
jgi:hypothetical protein